jgi:hypothetical protein
MPGSVLSGGPGRYSVKRSRQLGRRPAGEIAAILREHASQRATDQDWAHGQGPEVTGPSETLALAIGGRPMALDDLAGPGLTVLHGRLS